MPKEYKTTFTVPVINTPFGVVFTKNLDKTYKRYGGELSDVAAALGLCTFQKGKWWAMFPLDAEPSTIVHEAAHLTFFALDNVGIPVENGQPNEMYCYTLDYILDKLMSFKEKVDGLREEEDSDYAD